MRLYKWSIPVIKAKLTIAWNSMYITLVALNARMFTSTVLVNKWTINNKAGSKNLEGFNFAGQNKYKFMATWPWINLTCLRWRYSTIGFSLRRCQRMIFPQQWLLVLFNTIISGYTGSAWIAFLFFLPWYRLTFTGGTAVAIGGCYDTCIIKYDLEMFTLAAPIYNLAWLLSCRFHFRRSGPEQRMPDL